MPEHITEDTCWLCGAIGRWHGFSSSPKGHFVCPHALKRWHVQGSRWNRAWFHYENLASTMYFLAHCPLTPLSVAGDLQQEAAYIRNHMTECVHRLKAWMYACRGAVYEAPEAEKGP